MARGASVPWPERFQMLKNAGFNSGQAMVMTAISSLECRDCDFATENGSHDIGMMQINKVHWGSGDPRHSVYGDLTDPQTSAYAARSVFVGAGGDSNPTSGYKQWCVYPGGCGGAQNVPNQISQAGFDTLVAQVAEVINGTAPPAGSPPSDTPVGSPTPPGTPRTPVESNPCGSADKIDGNFLGHDFTITIGPIGTAACYLSQIFKWFTVRGHWWSIAVIVAGLALIVTGIGIYFRPDLAKGLKAL